MSEGTLKRSRSTKERVAKRRGLTVLMVMALVCSWAACSLAADAVPDLTGKWVGVSHSVVFGKLGHTSPTSKPAFTSVEFTIQIDRQEGPVFYGAKKSKKGTDNLVGVIKPDSKAVYMADHDGVSQGTLLSSDEMEIVYLEAGTKSRVASHTVFKRIR